MASGIASAPKSDKGPRSADEPTTPLPAQPQGAVAPADQIVVSPKSEADYDDLGDLDDLGMMESATISHLVSAAVGDADDDALGLSKPLVPKSGPASGILRPSPTPDDDALNLDVMPNTHGEDASLSFVARSDILRVADLDDAIATTPLRGFGAPRATPKPLAYAKDGTDIFSPGAPSSTARSGDSNLLSFLTGPKGESSNILSNAGGYGPGPTSDLFGDSRILTDLPPDQSRTRRTSSPGRAPRPTSWPGRMPRRTSSPEATSIPAGQVSSTTPPGRRNVIPTLRAPSSPRTSSCPCSTISSRAPRSSSTRQR